MTNTSRVKPAIFSDHPRRHSPLQFCMRGRVREVVIYFKFHENRTGVSELWGVENRPLPLTRPMAYTTACTTVQAVIHRILQPHNAILTRKRHKQQTSRFVSFTKHTGNAEYAMRQKHPSQYLGVRWGNSPRLIA